MDKYLKNVKVLSIAELVSKANILLLVPILARYLGTDIYGVFSQISVIIAVVTPLIILGVDSAIIRFLPGIDQYEQKRKFSGALVFIGGFSILIILVLTFLKEYIWQLFLDSRPEYIEIIICVLFLSVTNSIINLFKNWFKINNDSIKYSIILILLSLLNIVSVVAVVVIEGSVAELIQFRLAYEIFMIILMFFISLKTYGFEKPDFSWMGKFIKFGIPIVPGAYAMFILNSADRVVLVQNVSFAEIGIYSLAYNLGSIALQAFAGPIWTMFPNMASEYYNQGNMQNLDKLFKKSSFMLLYITVPLCIGSLVLGKELISVVGGYEYLTGGILISVVIFGYMFSVLSSYYDVLLGLVKKPYLSTVSIAVACVTNVCFNLVFVPIYGIYAAGIITAVSFCLQFILSFTFSKKYLFINLDMCNIYRICFCTALMGIAVCLSSTIIKINGLVSLLINITIGAVIYFYLTWKMKLIDKIRNEG